MTTNFSKLLPVSLCFVLSFIFVKEACAMPYKRVIALAPHTVEMLYLIGAGDYIVGTTEYSDYPEQAKNIKRVGGYNGIQIETVIELNPDLIIVWESGNPEEDVEKLKKLGFKVHLSKTRKLSEIASEIKELGVLTGKEAEANEVAENFLTNLNALTLLNQEKEQVSFFYQLWSQPLRTMAAGSWINEMMTICGGKNVFNDTRLEYPQVSLEHVLQLRPQVVIIPSHHGSVAGTPEQWRGWDDIPAVRNNHIFHIDGDILHRFSYRVLEGIEKVCEAFDKVRQYEGKVNFNSSQ